MQTQTKSLAGGELERCGMIPEDNPPEFFAKHLSAYHFLKSSVTDKTVLEVGFGDGYGMAYLAERAKEVVGIDIASPNIPLAQAKYPLKNLRFSQYDGLNFPFPDETFDVVGTFQVIEHIPEDKLSEWLGEIKRVLKKDGLFCASTLNLKNALKPGVPYSKNVDHHKEFYAHELEDLLGKTFGRVSMHGLRYSVKHQAFRRLKKWGLSRLPFVKSHFQKTSVSDFRVTQRNVDTSIDLIAVCRH